jgi:penicillin-binding protein 2
MATPKEPSRYEGIETRVQFIALGLAAALCVLVLQLWRLQVVNLAEFAAKAADNSVWEKRLESNRGVIYGHNGEVLADNRASVDIVLVPGDCPEDKREEVCERLEELLVVDADALMTEIGDFKHAPFTQIVVKRDVTRADRIRIEELSYALPGVLAVVRPQRRYLHGETAGQLIGYLGEINGNELERLRDEGYRQGDHIGKGGLELMYEDQLRGRDGYMLVTRYASGRPQLRTDRRGVPLVAPRDSHGHILVEEGARREPEPGGALNLTLDIDLQGKCESLLEGERGAIVVLNADTGAVLAMASAPTYDPSVFVTHGHNRERLDLLQNKDTKPMLHRAFRQHYPPGSVFKIMLAAAALEEGVVDKHTTHYCPGFFRLNNQGRKWHCWRRVGHGTTTVREAIAFSCDVYFYNAGLALGIDGIKKWAHKMGLGEKTGIDLPGEIPGLIPDREWKAALNADKPVWEQRWYDGETVNVSIGQGSVNATPLQNAVMMACIVNGGYRVRPYINADLEPQKSERLFSQETIDRVVEGMRLCVEKGPPAPTGTGHRAHIPGMAILGKTGSAQIMSLEHHEQFETEEDIPYEFRDHAWFVAGVIDRDPKIAICILVEHGHHGSSAASPLAKDIIEAFYGEDDPAILAQVRTEEDN